MKATAKHGWILVRRDEKETTKGMILLPDQAQKVSNRGTVISAGPGSYSEAGEPIPVEVVAGDRVIFVPNNIRPVPMQLTKGDTAEYVFVPYYSVLAKVEE